MTNHNDERIVYMLKNEAGQYAYVRSTAGGGTKHHYVDSPLEATRYLQRDFAELEAQTFSIATGECPLVVEAVFRRQIVFLKPETVR